MAKSTSSTWVCDVCGNRKENVLGTKIPKGWNGCKLFIGTGNSPIDFVACEQCLKPKIEGGLCRYNFKTVVRAIFGRKNL